MTSEHNIATAGYQLENVSRINVILGKNGCGKSTLLRELDGFFHHNGYVRYLTPERGGELALQGQIETNIGQNPNWFGETRRRNRTENFRNMSVTEFRRLETLVLRRIEKDVASRSDHSFTFDTTVEQINSLLDNVQIVRDPASGFKLMAKETQSPLRPDNLSSGESELISLATEILAFGYAAEQPEQKDKQNFLLIDEPDVHLHPDLQHRLMTLLRVSAAERPMTVIIATHSTAILSALDYPGTNVAVMTAGQKNLSFKPIQTELRSVLPIFGAHPLSNVFNSKPLMLLEGEDDQRIWEQAVRSSSGKLRLWPCPAGDKQSLAKFEETADEIIRAVYDNARGLSLRDRDEDPYQIDDFGAICRSRLNCRTAENLLVTDEVLAMMQTSWADIRAAFEIWLSSNESHPQWEAASKFKADNYNRRDANLKELRNLLMMLAGSSKPWEVAIGQSIAHIDFSNPVANENSLADFLGPKLLADIRQYCWHP